MTPKGQSARESRMRREGYDDGYAQRPARYIDQAYQAAWRRGQERRAADEWYDGMKERVRRAETS